LHRRIRIAKSGSNSTVLWNPWVARSQQMADFGNGEYKQMLCVESGNVANNKLQLEPGKSSVLKVELSSSPL
jgi:D-hexose-6-phosphate mutarotase